MSATIHRCGECNHKDADHAPVSQSPCSMGGCPCRLSQEAVQQANPTEEIPSFPGFDHATGRWAAR